MKTYKNELIDDSVWSDILYVYENFEQWAIDNNYSYEKVNCKSFQLPVDYPVYIKTENESGLIVWAGGFQNEGEFYIIPDEISVDLSNGIISCEDEFTLYKPELQNDQE